jgi:hypothetical protein
MYADLGSKTVIATPFRRVNFTQGLLTIDGDAANPNPTATVGAPTSGTISAANSPTINVGSTLNTAVGNALVIASGPGTGRYTITGLVLNTSITVDRPIRANGVAVTFTIHTAQGCMPVFTKTGAPKWGATDPLGLFCGVGAGNLAFNSIYVAMPRHLVPGWGELYVPLLHSGTSAFTQGLNYITNSGTAGPGTHADSDKNFVNYNPNPTYTYAAFSTVDLSTPGLLPAAYNTLVPHAGNNYAGMRFFTDTRGLDRQGLELPPFYGVARLFAVYEAADYKAVGSAFNDATRIPNGGGATNLLRQAMPQGSGPSFWVEIDSDGDSTFILNANAIDITKSPNPIANFGAGKYVIEASVFGFDRGTFDLGSEARLVMSRPGAGGPGSGSWTTVGTGPVDQVPANRLNNTNKLVAGPSAIIPGPAEPSDQILVNYSRTPYQGDAWGSQTNYADIPYAPGPLTSGNAYQIDSTDLDPNALTRPNQKVLEVLASLSFSTDLGTGRYSGDATTTTLDFKDVGYEDPTVYPPTSGIDPRPKVLPNNFVTADLTNIGTEYLGASTRLPLGALFRDKDFRGQSFSALPSSLIYSDQVGAGPATGLAPSHSGDQDEVLLNTASSGVGSPGDLLVHVDGEQGNYSLLTNFRVTRGGSVFTASGANPGGTVALQNQASLAQTNHVNVLQGRAMLVRNTVTNVGATEVSAGDELMLLILTTVQRPVISTVDPSVVLIGTNGTGEGYSAADLYRIEGHPLVRNNVRVNLDPATIPLSKRG